MALKAGDLDRRVGFFERVESVDGYGNTKAGYPDQPAFSVSARIVPRLGGEQVLQGRLEGVNLVNIIVRRSVQTLGVTTAWMAKDMRSGEVYNIRSIIRLGDDGIEMLCEKGVAI